MVTCMQEIYILDLNIALTLQPKPYVRTIRILISYLQINIIKSEFYFN